MILLSNVLGVN